jgi:hypothetical protein
LLKPIPFPHALAGMLKVRHLMWVIHSRDTWMHRLDICRAVGRPFQQTPEHDGRINQLVVLDASRELTRRLKGRGMVVSLSGTAGGIWRIGRGEPQAQLEMDVLDFNLFVSGRLSYVDAMGRARISGDRVLVENVLQNFLVLF